MGAPSLAAVPEIKSILIVLSKLVHGKPAMYGAGISGAVFKRTGFFRKKKVIEVLGRASRIGAAVGPTDIIVEFLDPYLKRNPKVLAYLEREKGRLARLRMKLIF
jgi:hypothetical protein